MKIRRVKISFKCLISTHTSLLQHVSVRSASYPAGINTTTTGLDLMYLKIDHNKFMEDDSHSDDDEDKNNH